MNWPGDQARTSAQATVRPAATPVLAAVIGLFGRLAALAGS